MINWFDLLHDWLVPAEKTWVDVFQALLTPVIALSALCLGFLQYRLALQRRRDDLWDRRHNFHERFRKFCWREFQDKGFTPEELRNTVPAEFHLFVVEARWLFDEQLVREIKSAPWQDWDKVPEDFLDSMPLPSWLQASFDRFLKLAP